MVIFSDNPEVMTHFVRCIEVKSNLAARCRYFVRCAEVTSNLVARCRYFVRCDGIAGPWPGAEQVLSLAEPPRCVAEPRSRLTKRCPVR